MFRSVMLFLPKAIGFLAILLVGWLIAKAVRKVVDEILERVGFDRVVDRGGIRAALARSRYDASDIVARLAYYTVLLFTLQLAFGIWGPNPVSDLIAGVIAWLPKAFVAILIVVVAAAIAKAVKDIISSALGGLSYGTILANTASVFILGLGVIAALNQIGVATTVTTPVLIAVLATIGGILVVGVGGGLVRPMQSRWETWLDHAARESQAIASHTRAYREERAERAAERAANHPTPTGQAPVGPEATQPVTYATGQAPGGTHASQPAAYQAGQAHTDQELAGPTGYPQHTGHARPAGGHPGTDLGAEPTMVIPAQQQGNPGQRQ